MNLFIRLKYFLLAFITFLFFASIHTERVYYMFNPNNDVSAGWFAVRVVAFCGLLSVPFAALLPAPRSR